MTVEQLDAEFALWNEETGLNLTYVIVFEDTTKKNWDGRVISWSPGTGAPLALEDQVTFFVGRYVDDG